MASYALVPHPLASSTSQSQSQSQSTTAQPLSIASTASALGVHDNLRHGLRSLAAELAPSHPLEARLANWDATQQTAKLTMHRGLYGLGMPLRQLMERDLVRQGTIPLPGQTRASNIHLDILLGRDEALDISDAFLPEREGPQVGTEVGDFHTAMEKRLRL